MAGDLSCSRKPQVVTKKAEEAFPPGRPGGSETFPVRRVVGCQEMDYLAEYLTAFKNVWFIYIYIYIYIRDTYVCGFLCISEPKVSPQYVIYAKYIYQNRCSIYNIYILLSVYRIDFHIYYVTICSFYMYLYTVYSLYSIFSMYTLYYILYIEYIEYRETYKTIYCIHYKHSIYRVWGVGQSSSNSARTVCPGCRTLTIHRGDLFGPGGGKGSGRKRLFIRKSPGFWTDCGSGRKGR